MLKFIYFNSQYSSLDAVLDSSNQYVITNIHTAGLSILVGIKYHEFNEDHLFQGYFSSWNNKVQCQNWTSTNIK